MRTLICEISGRRPGTSKQRPTEKQIFSRDHVIISNNSDGYITDWDIINVPDDFREDYEKKYRMTDTGAWLAPMNRSYAIKYAKEHGYDVCVQLDDNITIIRGFCRTVQDGITKEYKTQNDKHIADEIVSLMETVIECSNAGQVGLGMNCHPPLWKMFGERYNYSFFAVDLHRCPDYFQGDFEDDIEYRLKLKQLGIPTIMILPIVYGKTGQKSSKDESGNRAFYTEVGLKRGEHMRKLYGDIYSCGTADKTHGTNGTPGKCFKHKLKPFQIGATITNYDEIRRAFLGFFEKRASPIVEGCRITEYGKTEENMDG